MPRKLKLSWIASLKQWKKVYKGKQHWLGTGASKDDMQSYKLALEEFERRKVKIDAEARKANEATQYVPWQNSLASREGVDPSIYLVSGKATPPPPDAPLQTEAELMASVGVAATTYPYGPKPPSPKDGKLISQHITTYIATQKQRYLFGEKFPKAPQFERIGSQRFLAYQYNAGLMSASWKDEPHPQSEAELARLMIKFRDDCKSLLVSGGITEGTYNERIKTLRHFVGWLHDNYLIETLPRKTSDICAKYKLKTSAKAIPTAIIQQMFNAADDTLKCYFALALNLGFYAMDISSFETAKLKGDYLHFVRQKTGVPVRFKLWPITQALLAKQTPGKVTFFETADGGKIHTVEVTKNDKGSRKSKIENRFYPLIRKLKIEGYSFSHFRDTSTTWMKGHHRTLMDLFDAHSDQTMSQFYVDPDSVDMDALFGPLDKATDELEKHYGLTLEPPQETTVESSIA